MFLFKTTIFIMHKIVQQILYTKYLGKFNILIFKCMRLECIQNGSNIIYKKY